LATPCEEQRTGLLRDSSDICDEIPEWGNELEKHKTSQKHIDKAAGVIKVLKRPDFKEWTANNVAEKKYHCKLCDKSFTVDAKLQRYKKSMQLSP
jgi:hypothetical protein